MEPRNPYQPPATDVSAQPTGGTDQTGPFSPSGRFGRLSYIAWGTLLGVAGQLVTLAFGGTALMTPAIDTSGQPMMPEIGGAALAGLIVVGLVTAVIGVIFAIRRCHDFNASGWLVLLFLIPLVNLIFLLFMLFKPGTEGANSYGPPRVTPGWEKVVGIIGAVLIGLMLVMMVFAIAAPFILGVAPPGGA
jgi:uncharacterized membrane protein YhaH (DUF805 family)